MTSLVTPVKARHDVKSADNLTSLEFSLTVRFAKVDNEQEPRGVSNE
jgi:hypothetical protein